MATKANPGKYNCYGKAADDEPIFTLRAKDPVSDSFVEAWVSIMAGDIEYAKNLMDRAAEELRKSGRQALSRDSEKLIDACACAKSMISWRETRINKSPDPCSK